MSTNNTIPINWDTENDNALFGSLFPGGLSAPSFGDSFFENNSSLIKKRNALSYSPLSKNGSSVRDSFFGGSKIFTYANIQIIIDPTSGIDPKEKIKVVENCFYEDTNNSGIFGDSEDKYLFIVKVFVSEIKQELLDIYNNPTVIPADDEILLFLENNKGDWSGSTMYAKKGKNISDQTFKGLVKSRYNENELGYINELEAKYNISKPSCAKSSYEKLRKCLPTLRNFFYFYKN